MDSLLTSILIGLLATTSPCVFPLYPGYLAYIGAGREDLTGSRKRFFLGFFVLAGVLVMMLAVGGLLSALSISISRSLVVIVPLADLAILALGAALILDRNPFKALPQIRVPVLSHPFANAFLYGLLYGPIALPCSGPLVVSIFALSLTAVEAAEKLWGFLGFGLGLGLPLLLLSFAAGAAQRTITRLIARHSRWINLAAGILLVGIGLYDLWANWDLIRLALR